METAPTGSKYFPTGESRWNGTSGISEMQRPPHFDHDRVQANQLYSIPKSHHNTKHESYPAKSSNKRQRCHIPVHVDAHSVNSNSAPSKAAAPKKPRKSLEYITNSDDDNDDGRYAAHQAIIRSGPSTKVKKRKHSATKTAGLDENWIDEAIDRTVEFDPTTIASDILRALGKHPTLAPLNAHMLALETKGRRKKVRKERGIGVEKRKAMAKDLEGI